MFNNIVIRDTPYTSEKQNVSSDSIELGSQHPLVWPHTAVYSVCSVDFISTDVAISAQRNESVSHLTYT